MSKLLDVGKRRVMEVAPLEQLDSGLAANAPHRLLHVNASVRGSIIEVRLAVARIRELLPRIKQAMPDFDPRQLDELVQCAAALAKAEVEYRPWRGARKPPKELLAEGLTLRTHLLGDIRALIKRCLISERGVARLRGGNAYRNVALDLLSLAELLRANEKAVMGRCATSGEELDRAEKIAGELIDWAQDRHKPTPEAAAAALARARAFTLFSRTYAEVRRIV